MKNLSYIISFLLFGMVSFSCEYDNYEPPQLSYSGQLMYNDQPFLSDGNPNLGIIKFVQSGFGKVDPGIGARVDAKGHFNQLLFPGPYGLTLQNNQYPFEFEDFSSVGLGLGYDTIAVNMQSSISKEFMVTPYYEISDVEAVLSGVDVVATFKVNKVEGTERPAPAIVKARLYLSTSNIVNSATTCVGEVTINVTESGEIRVPASVVSYRNAYTNNFRDYAFYRVAVELAGIPNYYLFSDVKKIEEIPVEFNDVTADYMQNFKQEFEIETWFDGRRGKVKSWNASPGAEPTMYDGWGDRRFMSAENWCGGTPVNGGVWQTVSLPAGRYIFMGKRGWNNSDLNGGTDRAYLAVAEGDELLWNTSFIGKADLAMPQNKEALSVSFELTGETELSLGYVVNFPAGECNAISFTEFNIIKID